MKVVVTGSSSGLGFEIAKRLLGNNVSVIGVSKSDNLELNGFANYEYINCDFTNGAHVSNLRDRIKKESGTINGLVNNYAFFEKRPLSDIDYDYFSRVMYLNCYLPLELYRDVKAGGVLNKVVNISSLAGITEKSKFPGFGAYSMSKSALTALTQVISVENSEFDNIEIMCLAPGAMKTKMLNAALGIDYEGGVNPASVAQIVENFILTKGSVLDGEVLVLNSN